MTTEEFIKIANKELDKAEKSKNNNWLKGDDLRNWEERLASQGNYLPNSIDIKK